MMSKTLAILTLFWHPLTIPMYKCLENTSLEEINILEKRWRGHIHEVRRLSRNDRLICPGCRQPVHVKAGQLRRWHFAHHHQANCPLAKLSLLLLKARALLYDWLTENYQASQVDIEVEKDLAGLPRPADLWIPVDPHPVVYWIFDTRLAPEIRRQVRQALEESGARIVWVFTANFLREDSLHPGWIDLTTTEREFLFDSALDQSAEAAGDAPGTSIHYLELEKQTLVTYRRLRLQHPPQRYAGRKIEDPLQLVKIFPETGEPIHPEETAWLIRYQQKAAAAQERLAMRMGIKEFKPPPWYKSGQESLAEHQPFQKQAICRVCGKMTTEWVSFFGQSGTCLCRTCSSQGKT